MVNLDKQPRPTCARLPTPCRSLSTHRHSPHDALLQDRQSCCDLELDLETGFEATTEEKDYKELQLAERPRNKAPLGSLQRLGCAYRREALPSHLQRCKASSSSLQAVPRAWSMQLPASGLQDKLIEDWMDGEASFSLTWLLLHGSLARQNSDKGKAASRNLYTPLNLQPSSNCSMILEGLAGGLPKLSSQGLCRSLLAFPMSCSCDDLITSSLQWFRSGLGNEVNSDLEGLEGPLALELAFRRLCLHDLMANGNYYQTYLQAEIKLEILRVASRAKDRSNVSRKARLIASGELDREVLRILTPSDVSCSRSFESSNGNADLTRNIADYTLSLCKQKDDIAFLLQTLKQDDAYRTLAVVPGAPATQVVRAYRSKARELHPDRQGCNKAFQELQAAYELIQGIGKEPKGAVLFEQMSLPALPQVASQLLEEASAAIILAQASLKILSMLNKSDKDQLSRGHSRLTTHLEGTLQQASQVSSSINLAASKLNCQIVPLLCDVSTSFEDFGGFGKQLLNRSKALINELLKLADHSKLVSSAFEKAENHSDDVSYLELVERTASGVLLAVDAATGTFEAFQESRYLTSMQKRFQSRRCRRTNPDSEINAQEEAKPTLDEETSDDSDNMRLTSEGKLQRSEAALVQLNQELLHRQTHLREFVKLRPEILDIISPEEKSALFSLVCEVLSDMRINLEKATIQRDAENILAPAFIAVACNTIASPPSIEARLIRLAALIDALQLKQHLQMMFDGIEQASLRQVFKRVLLELDLLANPCSSLS